MSKDAEFVVQIIAKSVLENEQYFSELDGVVGDGDFGYSIARGFEKVLQEWDNLDHSLPGNFLKKISSIIMGSVGGVSGSIWGTSFLRAGGSLGTKTEIELGRCDCHVQSGDRRNQKTRQHRSGRQDLAGCFGSGCRSIGKSLQ